VTVARQLLGAHAYHRETASPFYDEVLDTVAARVASDGSLGKAEIGALVLWKRLRADARWVRALHAVPEREVRTRTAAAVDAACDRRVDNAVAADAARARLMGLPGFDHGDALASAVLLAASPDRMAVYDTRAQRGIERLGRKLDASSGRYGRYIRLIEELLLEVQVEDVRWHPRDVDLALYTIGA
jgi:hypothetical protein